MFIGRDKEIQLLEGLREKKIASLVVCKGRRRVGKSRLIQEFGSQMSKFIEFQGLPPGEGINEISQLKNFSEQLVAQFNLPKTLEVNNWTEAFALLANQLASQLENKSNKKNKGILVFLDEISWMAASSPDFVGKLKIAWDTLFKKNDRLILVLCGSISSWIEENILKNSGFVGRVSLTLSIEPLELNYCSAFWGTRSSRVSPMDKLKLISVTGGIPRYLEEINPKISAEENIKKLCFSKEGFLFNEFDKIFNDTFYKRAETYKKLVTALVNSSKTFKEVCKELELEEGGGYSQYLFELMESGFIERDFSWKQNQLKSTRNKYRLKDNYLRFYLKYIEPKKEKIKQGLFELKSLEDLPEWNTIMGLQFENLVLSNPSLILKNLNILPASVISFAPYFQATTKTTKACQIDLQIQTKNSVYICEVKFKKNIGLEVIEELKSKIEKIKFSSHTSYRPVLIYAGHINERVAEEDYFDRIINFEDLLK